MTSKNQSEDLIISFHDALLNQKKLDIKEKFANLFSGKKIYIGRGLNFYIAVSPKLKKEEKSMFNKLKSIKELKNNFSHIRVYDRGEADKNLSWIRIVAPFARFKVKKEDFESNYILLYDTIMEKILEIIHEYRYKLKGYERGFYWTNPESKDIVPQELFKLLGPKLSKIEIDK